MTNKRLTKSIKKFSKKKEDKLVTITGMLGLPLDGVKRVEVPNRDGFVFVRLKDNTSEVIQAYNSEVSNIYDLPVLVTRQNNVYKVIGRNLGLYRDWGNVPYLPKHGGQHSFNVGLGMGADVAWIYSQQFMPQLAYPSGTASMFLTVNPHVYEWNGVWKYAQSTGTPSFAPFVPTITGSARMALFYINGNDNSLNIAAGAPFSNSITDLPTLFSHLPDVPRTIGIPLAAVKLPTGTSTLDWTNIYDVRDFFTVGFVSGTSGGANPYVQNQGVPLGQVDTLNFFGNNVEASVSGTVARVFITGSAGGGVTKIITGSNMDMQYTGAEPGTGEVTLGVTTRTIQDIVGQVVAGGQQTNIQVTYESENVPPDMTFTVDAIPPDGWNAAPTLTYRSSDSPSFVVTSEGNATGTVGVGMKFKLNHLGQEKFFITTHVAITGSFTYYNLYGGTDYSLTTGTITVPYYSPVKSPFGFPTDPDKWTVETTDTSNQTQSSPTQNTWYNIGSLQISIPIGGWNVSWEASLRPSKAAATSISQFSTLSTTNNSESDSELTKVVSCDGASATLVLSMGQKAEKILSVSSKTTYFLNAKSGTASMGSIAHRGDVSATVIKAVCAYL
jgi:hypothetical protein